ncbi:MAG: thioredoxin family protein [Campylobacterales bacterium]|nr:thioredoxin family protein [Campylobacterales bacterium]
MKLLLPFLFLFFLIGCKESQIKKTQLTQYEKAMSNMGKNPMVLELGTPSCYICGKMKTLIKTMKKEDPNLPIYVINVEKHRDLAIKYKVRVVPVQVAINSKGEEILRNIGGLDKEELLQMLASAEKDK